MRVAVLASGGGSNLQAMIERFAGSESVRIELVISDREAAGALTRARSAGSTALHIPVAGRPEADVTEALLAALAAHAIDLVALAGYLRLVPADVVSAFRGRILNIHPALLPAFGGSGMYGRRVHEAVLRAGSRVTGATVHHVDERYDEGRIVAQWPVPVLPGDDVDTLAARVLRVEHRLYPEVIAAIADGRGPPAAGGEVFRLDTSDAGAGTAPDMIAIARI
jgi:formyltetrahydrofolate-dependent phosphoribosylglycinamide formyltransferase